MEVDEKSDLKEAEREVKSNKVAINVRNTFDLNDYKSHYKGKTLVDRMLHIASLSPDVQSDALKIAVAEVGKGIDVSLYDRVTDQAQKILGASAVTIDAAWMQKKSQENDKKNRYLEDEIQRWRNLSNRERICAAYLSAAEFCMKTGNYNTAISRYIEAKSYANDQKMLIDINLKIMTASILSGQFGHVKPEGNHALSSDEIYKDSKFRSKVLACVGLYHLHNGRYDSAVQFFLDCQFSIHNQFNEVIASKDIALYGGLCALASFSRRALKTKVLDNGEFKRFLELTPAVAALVQGFYESEYGKVMSGLSSLKNELLLDMYLYSRVENMLTAIRGKALVQYFSPYSAMNMHKMAEAFEVSVEEMEMELSSCIADNHIKAKIDAHEKIVYANKYNRRKQVFDQVLQMGEEFNRDIKAVLLRQSLARNGVIVSQQENNNFDDDMGGDDKGGLAGMMSGVGKRFGFGGPQRGGYGGYGGGGGRGGRRGPHRGGGRRNRGGGRH